MSDLDKSRDKMSDSARERMPGRYKRGIPRALRSGVSTVS